MEESIDSACVICCCSIASSLSTKGIQEEEEAKAATISKFCQQIHVNSDDSSGTNGTVGFSVCPECFVSVSIASATREKAEEIEGQVRSLQREVLKLLRHLQQCMDGYLSEMRAIEDKIKSSDVTRSKTRMEGSENLLGVSHKIIWRDKIIDVVKDLCLFQNQLSSKVISEDEHPSGLQATVQIKTEAEDNADVEAPEFFDLPEPQFQDDEDVDEKHVISSIRDHNSGLSRRTRRSAAATATMRIGLASARRPVVKKIKTEKVNSSGVPSKTTSKCGRGTLPLPKWVIPKRVRAKTSKVRGPSSESRRSYRCELCPKFISRAPYHLEHHLRQHELDLQNSPKTFTCPHCSLSFALKQLYEYHVACHERLFQFVCDICNQYLSPLDMEAHFKEVHGESSKIIRCDNCLYCCSTRDTYLEHLRTRHFGDKVSMTCDLCFESFYTRREHLKHLHETHGAIEMLECGMDGCQRPFLDIWLLKAHQVLHKRPFTCLECDYKCTNAGQLESHQTKHSSNRPFKCTRCALTFKTENGIKKHEAIHDRDPTTDKVLEFQCHLCEKAFKHKRTFESHLRFHEGQGFTCDQCGFACAHKASFKRHLESHGDRGPKCFCEHCGKGFRSGQHLKRHVRTQHESTEKDKKYKCSECSKAFHNSHNLKQHLRIHTGEKPFVCDACGKAFNQAGSLWHHRRLLHGVKGNSSLNEHPSI